MNEGWIVFRDPSNGQVQGWKGAFSVFNGKEQPHESSFLIKPWEPTTPPQILNALYKTTESSEFSGWIQDVDPGLCPKTNDVNSEEFEHYIHFVQTGIRQGDFEKVVASRCETRDRNSKDLEKVFFSVCSEYPESFVYLMNHPKLGLWMGASPEKFAFLESSMASMNAMAGTVFQPEQKFTAKEKDEQSVTAKYLSELLESQGIEEYGFTKTEVKHQGPISHLASEIKFRFAGDIASFIRAAHPTPAVGGYPKQSALLFIERFEDLERELFTGWLGFISENELRTWVNIRCARIYSNKVKLYAGCGINEQSQARMEWDETAAKLNILGKFFT